MKNFVITVTTLCVILGGVMIAAEPVEQKKLVVEKVMPNSPHEKAGIAPNDVLIKYDGKIVNSFKELGAAQEQVESESIEVVFLRGQQEIKFKIAKGQTGVSVKEYLPDIKYKENAVIIKGIPKLGWDKMNSFLGCVELVANHLGIKKDYAWINSVSGAAFRLQFCKDWCPSSPDPTCGYNSGEEALNALGLEYKSYNLATDGKNKPEILNAIKQSIDNNKPVIAIDLIQVPEWGIITGYQNNGEELLCRTYFDKRQSYEIAQKFPWAVYIITGRSIDNNFDPYIQSFKTILANLTAKNYDQYYSGINAFDQWIEHLEKGDFAKMDSSKYHNAIVANAWIFDRLAIDRKNGVDYLEYVANEQMPGLAERLFELAFIYKQESEMLQETKINIPNSNIIKSTGEWTPKMRQEQVILLKQAKAKEEAALKIWQEIVKEK